MKFLVLHLLQPSQYIFCERAEEMEMYTLRKWKTFQVQFTNFNYSQRHPTSSLKNASRKVLEALFSVIEVVSKMVFIERFNESRKI